jgi:fused signal recognition particle receptor
MDIVILAIVCLVVALVGTSLMGKRRLEALPPARDESPKALGESEPPPVQSVVTRISSATWTPIVEETGATAANAKTSVAPHGARPENVYRAGLGKTRSGFVAKLDALLRGKPKVDADLRDELEAVLYGADIGAGTAERLLNEVHQTLSRAELADRDAVWSTLAQAILAIADLPPPAPITSQEGPEVVIAVGVNGVGKTTTLAKLAARAIGEGRKVLLVAGDTFRAAAAEQLETWAHRIGAGIHVGKAGADPAGVIHEGISLGRREKYDLILCDTAGRLHTRKELMDELNKIYRSASKAMSQGHDQPYTPHQVLLVLDATIGQNALAQAQLFKDTVALSGIVVTKLDGTAKGGVVIGICDTMKVPILWVGLGEKAEDLRPFAAKLFVDALLDRGEPTAAN